MQLDDRMERRSGVCGNSCVSFSFVVMLCHEGEGMFGMLHLPGSSWLLYFGAGELHFHNN